MPGRYGGQEVRCIFIGRARPGFSPTRLTWWHDTRRVNKVNEPKASRPKAAAPVGARAGSRVPKDLLGGIRAPQELATRWWHVPPPRRGRRADGKSAGGKEVKVTAGIAPRGRRRVKVRRQATLDNRARKPSHANESERRKTKTCSMQSRGQVHARTARALDRLLGSSGQRPEPGLRRRWIRPDPGQGPGTMGQRLRPMPDRRRQQRAGGER